MIRNPDNRELQASIKSPMPVYSMTGYASAQHSASVEGGQESQSNSRLGLEIRAVNSRFLDLSFRLPDELRALEPALRTLLTARLKRGKVEVRAAIDVSSNQSLPIPAPPSCNAW
jgi:uncharacterized protein (TIGR00255 family)